MEREEVSKGDDQLVKLGKEHYEYVCIMHRKIGVITIKMNIGFIPWVHVVGCLSTSQLLPRLRAFNNLASEEGWLS